jgi:hypothetical protein
LKEINININTEIKKNRRIFTKIAFIVDRDLVMLDIEKSRKKLHIDQLIPYSFFHLQDKIHSLPDGIKLASQYLLFWKSDYVKFVMLLDEQVETIRMKYCLGKSYTLVLLYSILCGEVRECDFSPSTYLLRSLETEHYGQYKSDDVESFIVINPDSTKDEVLGAYQFYKQRFTFLVKNYKPRDTISNIKDHREWYFMNKRGLSPKKIWEICKNKGEFREQKTIEAAITQYKERLRTPLFSPP